ncbi:hypothetical protein CLV40_13734 [Actinokineospora auranticolor]|uniref:Uncharacterized protein n=1 Tax=Actinokineospora auranticolor TaxID=155976 RepID=A0A2S6GC85_9PSEU|nr:hypothetical protein CLV40_13734 [Actinokineospora auranticolor]
MSRVLATIVSTVTATALSVLAVLAVPGVAAAAPQAASASSAGVGSGAAAGNSRLVTLRPVLVVTRGRGGVIRVQVRFVPVRPKANPDDDVQVGAGDAQMAADATTDYENP